MLAKPLGLNHYQRIKRRESVYGLIDAPHAEWEGVEKDTTRTGWRTLTAEPCFGVKTSQHVTNVIDLHDLTLVLEVCGSNGNPGFDGDLKKTT